MPAVQWHSASEDESMRLAATLAAAVAGGELIGLSGDLGAGKTTFARGFLRALGYDGIVKSPTFTLVESYALPGFSVHHFDLFRLTSARETHTLGFDDYLAPSAVCLIEWPERGGNALPSLDIHFRLSWQGANRRAIGACTNTAIGARLLKEMKM